jgi:hypothetical protein
MSSGVCLTEATKFVFLYKYLIIIHSLACFLVIKQFFVVGFRSKKGRTSNQVKWALFAALLVPLSQIPASIFRYITAHNNNAVLTNPEQAYLDFFWSPMMTVFITWLFQVYISKFCFQIDRIVRQENIIAFLAPHKLVLAVLLGVLTAAIATQLTDCHDITMRSIAYTALGFTTIESVASSYFHKGKTNLVSYTLFWVVGTWVYFAWWINFQ